MSRIMKHYNLDHALSAEIIVEQQPLQQDLLNIEVNSPKWYMYTIKEYISLLQNLF